MALGFQSGAFQSGAFQMTAVASAVVNYRIFAIRKGRR